jgi:hypothetical protein
MLELSRQEYKKNNKVLYLKAMFVQLISCHLLHFAVG